MPLLLSSHWPGLSHIATDSYMGVWDIFLLEDLQLELKIRGSVIWKKGEKVVVDNMLKLHEENLVRLVISPLLFVKIN